MIPPVIAKLHHWYLDWRHRSKTACAWPPEFFWGRRRERRISPLLIRILAVNVMALALLVGSLLYLGHYREKLISTELDGLLMQGRLSASAVAEGAVVLDRDERNILSPLLARLMIRRLVEAGDARTRLYDMEDTLLADSEILLDSSGKVQMRHLPRSGGFWPVNAAMGFFDAIERLVRKGEYPAYPEEEILKGDQFDSVKRARDGEAVAQVWRLSTGGLVLSVAVPVQRYKQVLGVVFLTRTDAKISAAIRSVRIDILKIFAVSLLITVLLSSYLARAIASPIKQLAQAAETVRIGQMQMAGLSGTAKLLKNEAIPDFSHRRDEIGDLSAALREMTQALARRIGAIENFAADVAHEIKNPLTSLRSAVETAQIVKDPERQQRLMQVIRDDVDRLDRLISDISNASRLDGELTRDEAVPLDVVQLLTTLVGYYGTGDEQKRKHQAAVRLDPMPEGEMLVAGVEGRLVQVLQNLIGNALSFTPADSEVTITAVRGPQDSIDITVSDHGGGVPDNKLEAVFDRFYTERPKQEKFGTHSGLGLSISKQIVEAHHGRIWAENLKAEDGTTYGARFHVRLPSLTEE